LLDNYHRSYESGDGFYFYEEGKRGPVTPKPVASQIKRLTW
jgi:hypothetical protein